MARRRRGPADRDERQDAAARPANAPRERAATRPPEAPARPAPLLAHRVEHEPATWPESMVVLLGDVHHLLLERRATAGDTDRARREARAARDAYRAAIARFGERIMPAPASHELRRIEDWLATLSERGE